MVRTQKKFIVKDWNKYLSCNGEQAKLNTIIDSRRVRPTPPTSPVDQYTLTDRVEAFHGSGWYQGLVKGVLLDKRYSVCLEPTKKESDFKHSGLRSFMVWEDGVWHKDPKPKPIKETPSNVIKRKSMRSSSGAKPMTPEMATMRLKSPLSPEEIDKTHTKTETVETAEELGKKRADAVVNDKTPPVIITQVTSIGKSFTPVTPSPVITATPLQQIEAEIVGKKSPKKTPLSPMKKGLENSSTRQEMLEEENSKENYRKRKREEQHKSDLNQTDEACNGSMAVINDTELSFDQTPNVVDNSASEVQETQAKHTLTIFPFVKNLPFWKTYETEEVYKTVPQDPHFSPLFKAKEDIREWSAVGMMVSFYGLLEEVRGLQLGVSTSKRLKLWSLSL